ncbi:MAG: SPOR domain-containing protein [Paludibacteraceae bacterium]|nr:SPOR domain-containing protein [Paludibacteraceae bacterium]
MKKILFILAIYLPTIITAQDVVLPVDTVLDNDTALMDSVHVVLITEDMSNAIVHQDSAIIRLMTDKRLGRVRGEQIVDGFRVQVYASNRQQVAKNEALMLQQRIEPLLEVPVYALSEPPFWKVRIGNFLTREDANAYKDVLLNMFPDMVGSTYVVPDKIILVQ